MQGGRAPQSMTSGSLALVLLEEDPRDSGAGERQTAQEMHESATVQLSLKHAEQK